MIATSAAAAGASAGARTEPRARAAVNEAPRKPPSTPAAIAVTRTGTIASAIRLSGHGTGIQACDQPYSAANPTVPISAPERAPNAYTLRVATTSAAASTQRASAR